MHLVSISLFLFRFWVHRRELDASHPRTSVYLLFTNGVITLILFSFVCHPSGTPPGHFHFGTFSWTAGGLHPFGPLRLLDDTNDPPVLLYSSCFVLDGWLGISVAPLRTESAG